MKLLKSIRSHFGHRGCHRGRHRRKVSHCEMDLVDDNEIDQNFRKSALCEELAHFFRPCRGPVHPDGCLAPRKLFHMTRRALPAQRVIRLEREIALQLVNRFFAEFGHGNGNISRSVKSFALGPILQGRLGQDLSIGGLKSKILFPERKFEVRKDFCMLSKIEFFMKISKSSM